VTDIDLSIDRRTGDVLTASAENVVVTRDVARDPAQTELIARYRQALGPIAGRVVGTTSSTITKTAVPSGESPLGNLIADAQLAATDDEQGAVAAFMNPGGVRADLPAGEVTYEQAFTVQPFANNLVTLDLTGAQVQCLLEQQYTTGKVLQPSDTVRYTVTASGAPSTTGNCAGGRVLDETVTIGGVAVVDGQTYRVTVNNFLAGGGDGFTVLTGGTNAVTGPIDLDAFTAYLTAESPVAPPATDRITVQ
jgi:5'-nucleotidase